VRKEYNINGQKVWGEEVEFEPDRESWSSYILHDGTTIKMRSVVTSIIRLEVFKPDGEPVYFINSSNIAAADVPDRLKQKPSE
jgi:hypothetical protein